MNAYNESDIKIVNKLIAICIDGEKFYQSAINEINAPNLKAIFTDMANVRKKIVADLSMEVRFSGEEPEESGTLVGNLRQAYASIKKTFSTQNNSVVLVEQLEEAEDRALKNFREGVNDIQDSNLKSKVAAALASIQMTHEKMRSLKLQITA